MAPHVLIILGKIQSFQNVAIIQFNKVLACRCVPTKYAVQQCTFAKMFNRLKFNFADNV